MSDDGSNSGVIPARDGAARGLIAAGLTAVLAFANSKVDWLTDGDVVTLAPVVVGVAFIIGGLYDGFVRPRLNS